MPVVDKRDELKYLSLARYYIRKKYGLTFDQLEMLLFLKSEKYFSRTRFAEYENIYPWNSGRFEGMVKKGFIQVFRQRNRKEHTIYCLSKKALMALNIFYSMLHGENIPREIKRDKNYQVVKDLTARERIHRAAIRKWKKELDQLNQESQ